ncbi:periplasmic nitrate reductase, NapE protein [Corticimicrobacter populi]|uniref:Nitrate reductase n=1 Tax=Corticimicrobacter populi TaxID=2175229 RepID=A0A2V1JWT8_9BURK|nr:periplasmic nitrate reductase, NapE protein [Corticimicrobacter populi]PWF21248.1 hypothetical protein DD235_15665 [Corticimicrobacter populi]
MHHDPSQSPEDPAGTKLADRHPAQDTHPVPDTRTGRREWRCFLMLACVGLPLLMVVAIAAYGFVVWMLQIFFFGPPK